MTLDRQLAHRVLVKVRSHTKHCKTREVRCDTGAVPATVIGKLPSSIHSLPPSGGYGEGRRKRSEQNSRNPRARKPTCSAHRFVSAGTRGRSFEVPSAASARPLGSLATVGASTSPPFPRTCWSETTVGDYSGATPELLRSYSGATPELLPEREGA